MNPNNVQRALDRVVEYLRATIRLETTPTDDEYEMAQTLMSLINEELEKK